jgi:hypothetical protein
MNFTKRKQHPHPLVLQNSPCLLIHSGEDHTSTKQFITTLRNLSSRHVQLGRNNLQVQTSIILRLSLEQVINLLRNRRHRSQSLVLPSAVFLRTTHNRIAAGPILRRSATRRAARKEQMHSGSLEEMAIQLVEISQRPHTMSTDVALVSERLDGTKDAGVAVELELALAIAGRLAVVCIHVVGGRRVNPFLDFDFACAVVDFVCDVCALGADVADLTHEEDVGYVGAVDLEWGFGVRLRGVEDLLHCHRAEGLVVPIASLSFTN